MGRHSGAHTAFADGYPLLVVTEASLADLNRRLEAKGEQALPMNRFRPNIVLAGMEPYDEDHIDTLAVDGVVIKLVKPCARCQITTTDQESMQTGAEPLQMLGTYRMDERVGGVTFGLNAIIVEGEGRDAVHRDGRRSFVRVLSARARSPRLRRHAREGSTGLATQSAKRRPPIREAQNRTSTRSATSQERRTPDGAPASDIRRS